MDDQGWIEADGCYAVLHGGPSDGARIPLPMIVFVFYSVTFTGRALYRLDRPLSCCTGRETELPYDWVPGA